MKCLSILLLALSSLQAQGIWERRAPFPIQATEVSAAALGGKVYVVCGLTVDQSVSTLYIYDPRTDSWTQGPSAPIPNGGDHCNVAAANGKLYVLGYIRVGTTVVDGTTYEYDPATNAWQTVGRMNTPRGASGVAAIGSKIYVAGGLAASGSVADFEVFDVVTRVWTRLPNMPTVRDHLTAQAVNGKFYAISGRASDIVRANEEFDPATNMWRARAPIPTPRGGIGSGTLQNRIQVFGGEGPSGTPESTFRQNEEYDPATDTWRSLAPMPTPRHGLYGATLDGRIFVPSGGPRAGADFTDIHEAFYLPPTEPSSVSAVRDAAGFGERLSPGALASVFGMNLGAGEQIATRLPLPTQMNGIAVRVNQTLAPLLYAGPNQINLQIPSEIPVGVATLTVVNAGSPLMSLPLRVESVSPAIFPLNLSARRGQFIEIYCTGLGDPKSIPPITVTIGAVEAQVTFAGLAPGLTGAYQVNARVPDNAPVGAQVPIVIRAGEANSNTVTIAVSE